MSPSSALRVGAARLRAVPRSPYRWAVVAWVMAVLWLGGGVALLAAAVPLPQPGAVAAAGGLAAAIGVGVALVGGRLPGWALALSGGTALVALPAAVVAAGGGPTSVAVVLATALCLAVWVVRVALDGGSEVAIDALTGIPGRSGVERLVAEAIHRAEDDGTAVSVAVLDIDGFRGVNERQGRRAGDRLLRRLVAGWSAELVDGQLIGRLGGDEFAVVLTDHSPANAKEVVERLRLAGPAGLSCTAGVASWRRGDSISMLIGRARAALHEAKRRGRQRTVVDKEDPEAVRSLSEALANDEFVVYYQPKVSLHTGRISGFEALVRREHPVRGLLPPSEFIAVAEDSGLIVAIGEQVLRRACHQARTWADMFPDQTVPVAVNVAGRQLDDAALVGTVQRALADSGLAPGLLSLEVTETTLGENLGAWTERLETLAALGVGIAMDDFGTGYSSLSQLRRLPVSTVKIDQSFVTDLAGSQEAQALVAAMIGIGQGLQRRLVAEGVETLEQLRELSRLGCDEAQGYLFGRPLPAEVTTAMIYQQHRFAELLGPTGPEPSSPATVQVAGLVEDHADLEASVRPLLDHLVDVSGLESAYLTRIRWDRLEQEVCYALNTAELQITEGAVVSWADTVCRRALEDGPTRTDNVPEVFAGSPAAEELALQSYATAPVVLGDGNIFGTLCVASHHQTTVSDGLMTLLTLYSRLIADSLSTPYTGRERGADGQAR